MKETKKLRIVRGRPLAKALTWLGFEYTRDEEGNYIFERDRSFDLAYEKLHALRAIYNKKEIEKQKQIQEEKRMDTYYFTFGVGQMHNNVLMEGKCQPIKAKDKATASNKMREIYGTKWSFCYTQEEWNRYPSCIKEKQLKTITVK